MTEPIRVLYVDDEAHSLALRKELLERQGSFEVTAVTSVAEGLEQLEENEYDCLVSDFNMPETDGIEFLNAVREEYPDLPFIIFSGEDSEEAVHTAIEEGATDYLPKSTASISYQLFAHRIRQAVAGNTTEDSSESEPPTDVTTDDPEDQHARDTSTIIEPVTASDEAIEAGFSWLEGDTIDESELEGTPIDEVADAAAISSGFDWLDSNLEAPSGPVSCPVPSCSFTADSMEVVATHGASLSTGDSLRALHHRRQDWEAFRTTDEAEHPESRTADPEDTHEAESTSDDEVEETDDGASPPRPSEPQPSSRSLVRTIIEDPQSADRADLEALSTLDLYDLARRFGVSGRSSLDEDELIEAVYEQLPTETEATTDADDDEAEPEEAPHPRRGRDRGERRYRRRAHASREERSREATAEQAGAQQTQRTSPSQADATQAQSSTQRQPDDLLAELLDLLANRLRGPQHQQTGAPATGQAPQQHQPAGTPSADQRAQQPTDAPREQAVAAGGATEAESTPETEPEPATTPSSEKEETGLLDDADDEAGTSTEDRSDASLFDTEDSTEAAQALLDQDDATDDDIEDGRTGVIDDVDEIDINPGETGLVICDSHDEHREAICDRLLIGAEETNTLLIRFTQVDTDTIERLAETANELHIISVGYDQRVPPSVEDIVETSKVNNATDLTRLGIITTSVLDGWEDEPHEVRVCFDSINVLLRYRGIERIFQFLHLLMGKLEVSDAVTHFHIDPSSEEAQDVGIFRTLMDIVIDDTGDDMVLKES